VCGDGGVEAGRLLGLLGLNDATTMGPRSFGIVEECMGPVVGQHGDEIVHQNLCEEVKLHFDNKRDDAGNSLHELWQQDQLPNNNHKMWPQLVGTHAMAWQGRSSGNQHNGLPGDGLAFGALTRKAIARVVISKGCIFCNGWKKSAKMNLPIPEHDCRKNWD